MRIMINSKKFRAILVEKGIRTEDLAKELEISQGMLNQKINNTHRFNLDNIFIILKILDMKFEDVFKIERE